MSHCLANINLIPPCDRILLEMTFAELSKWAIGALRESLLEADRFFRSRGLHPARHRHGRTKVNATILLE